MTPPIFSILLGILTPVGLLLALLAGIYLITKKRNTDSSVHINEKGLVSGYAWLVVLATVIMLGIGLTNIHQSWESVAFGNEFAYAPQWQPCTTSTPEAYCDGKFTYDDLAAKRDLVQGVTLVVIAVLIGVLHWAIASKYNGTKEGDWARKWFIVFGLIGSSIVSLVTLPMATFSTINYILYGIQNTNSYMGPTQYPGGTLAAALAFLPIWIVFLVIFLRERPRKV